MNVNNRSFGPCIEAFVRALRTKGHYVKKFEIFGHGHFT